MSKAIVVGSADLMRFTLRPIGVLATVLALAGCHDSGPTEARTLETIEAPSGHVVTGGPVVMVGAGDRHTCALKTDGTIACWGDNKEGQSTPSAGTFMDVSAGNWHTCAIKVGGSVACWGNNSFGQLTAPAGNFSQVSARAEHTCALKTADGSISCWGDNSYGQNTPPAGSFTEISAGATHACAIKANGTIACWGTNFIGEASPPTGTFTHVSASYNHSCGLKTDGTLACWGGIDNNAKGQATAPSGSFTQVTTGGYHSCAVKVNASITCWGRYIVRVDEEAHEEAPTPPAGAFSQVSSGAHHTCAVRTDGTAVCWGDASSGQIFVPPALADITPPIITAPAATTVSTDPGTCSANVSLGTATAVDNRDGSVEVTAAGLPQGSIYPMGTTSILWTATDEAGNAASATTLVTVIDRDVPSITSPASIAANTDPGRATATVNPGTATAVDACPGVSVSGFRSDGQPLGAQYPVGTTTIIWTAVDPSGNTMTAMQTITVSDAEPPAVTVPASFAVDATSPSGAVVTYPASASDNVGVTSQGCAPTSGSLFPIGTTIVACTAADAAGNAATASFTVTVKGAADQMTDLKTTVENLDIQEGTETSLKQKLDAALASHGSGNTTAACNELDAMINQINAQIGKKITADQASTLLAEINRIRAVIGCS